MCMCIVLVLCFPSAAHAPTSQSETELLFTDEELMSIAEQLPGEWQRLGIKLGLAYSILESVRMKHVLDPCQAAMEMFSLWQRTKGEQATRSALRQALVSVGYARLASTL